MSPHLPSARQSLPQAASSIPVSSSSVFPRHGDTADFLKGWDANGYEGLKYSFGLTGVDQTGNYLWVHTLLWVFLGLAVFTLGLHIFNMCWRQMRHISAMGDPTRQGYWRNNQTSWWPWMQRHLFASPLFRKKHNNPFKISNNIDNGTLPGRWNTILLFVYVVLNVVFCCALPKDATHVERIAALRGRSGTMAALNLIPTILFALRNNPLIALLQVSYDDFNLFHRWAARITIAEAIVHTAAWAYNTATAAGWKAVQDGLSDEASYTWGLVGTVVFTFIGFQAWSPFRHAFYEAFLNIHRVCVVGALLGLYKHLELHGLPQLPWMYLVFFMWSAEIATRIFRGLWNNFRFSTLRRKNILIEAMPGEAVRVTVDLARPWYPKPGCHAHIYMPALTPLAPWTSHPFSIAWAPTSRQPPPDKQELTPANLESQPVNPHAPRPSQQVSFICRARNGLTRKMYDRAASAPDLMFRTTGAVEGPYGGHHSLDSYGTVLLFAGGVGITHQVMYLSHLIRSYTAGTSAIQKLVLVWTVPNSECLEWVRPWMDEILRLPDRKKVLKVQLFITRPKGRLTNVSDSVRMYPGRPGLPNLIGEEARARVGAMAVTVCGSGPFADDVREAVRPWIGEGSVDFIEEAFTY